MGILAAALLFTLGAENALQPQEIAPGVFCLTTDHKHGAVNVGWVALGGETLLIGSFPADLVPRILSAVDATTHAPVRTVVITHLSAGSVEGPLALAAKGARIVAATQSARTLTASPHGEALRGGERIVEVPEDAWGPIELGVPAISSPSRPIQLFAAGRAAPGGLAINLKRDGVLFAGPLCINGPRVGLPGRDTARWLKALSDLQVLSWKAVVPGEGTPAGTEILERQRRFLREMRQQVGFGIVQAKALDLIQQEARLSPEFLVWMPYDNPLPEDFAHVYSELTIPRALEGGIASPDRGRPKALVLIGDRVHEPQHLEDALAPVFEKAGIDARFVVDVRALSRESLRDVQLFAILRDGWVWDRGPGEHRVWMTPEQEQAVEEFVQAGGGFLPIHNATGLYPEGGAYLRTVGGTYNGHGPLERFRVRVKVADHPIVRGVQDYEVADEQHTPVLEKARGHVFLESTAEDGTTAAAGWAFELGRGRVAYLANGHTRETLLHPMVQRLLENAARWCVKRTE